LWGTPEDTAEAEGFARRLAEQAEELGALDMAVHGRSLLAIMARFTGRLDEAAHHAAVLQRLSGILEYDRFPWLGWAAIFVVSVARGATDVAAPLPPASTPDPVVGMAQLVVEAELTVGGRVEEALDRLGHADRPDLGPFGDLAGMLNGLALVLADRATEALPWIERAADAARALEARPTAAAAAALRAEIAAESLGSEPGPTSATSISQAVVLRSRAVRGDPAAFDALRRCASRLVMPGLLLGLD